MLFTVNAVDYTPFIISESYKINRQDAFRSWTDANGIQHRVVYRTKVSGSFEIKFINRAMFQSFLTALEAVKQDGYHTVSLYINNTLTVVTLDAFITIEPAMQAQYSGVPEMCKFTVKVEER